MRRASILFTVLGAVLLLFALAAPAILRWQTQNTLERYGAAKYVDLAVSSSLERIAFDLLLSKIVASALFLSGLLMLYRRKSGLYLALCALVVAIGTSLFSFAAVEVATISLVKVLGWTYALYFVLKAHRRDGAIWWCVLK
jgi:hypothetical protein